MNLAYELRSGSYYLVDLDEPPSRLTGEREIRLMTDIIAICFDRETGTLMKHGSPSVVEEWHKKAILKYLDTGFPEMAGNLIVVSGAFPVEEINKCLSTSGYCLMFMGKLGSMMPTKAQQKIH